MGAPNVLTVPVDPILSGELTPWAKSKFARWRLYSRTPTWASDIRWYSARSEKDFRKFESLFQRLEVARHVEPYVDLEREIRLYNGQFVSRRVCTAPNFHVDWDSNNEAFTFLSPLTVNTTGFGMLYKKLDGSIGEYEYKVGEALIFGDDFLHSTKPGASEEPVILLCFSFGTDKMQYWPGIERLATRQCLLACRPDGTIQKMPLEQRIRALLGPVLRNVGLLKGPPMDSHY